MPAPPLANTLEGQGNGVNLTAANSGGGSGDAFSTHTTGAGATNTYSNDHAAHGTTSMRIAVGLGAVATRVDWTGLGSGTSPLWFRCYLRRQWRLTTGQTIFVGFRDSGALLSAQVRIQGASPFAIRVEDATPANVVALQGTVGYPPLQWTRFECRIVAGAGTGEFEWRIYHNPDAPVAEFTESKSATGLTLAANTDQVRFGIVTNPVAWDEIYLDSIAVSSTDWIGPDTSSVLARSPALHAMPLA